MTKGRAEIVAKVYRGDTIEAVHYGSIAVVGPNGRLTHSLGDPHMVTMARSSIKPFQLLPLLLSGAADRFGYSDEQLAIMCGSHNGSDKHRSVVLSNLELSGNSVSDLQCGSHWPMGMKAELCWPQAGEDLDPARHNCSGKHSGFLALAKHMEVEIADYLNPESASQQLVKQSVADYCQYDQNLMPASIDGCSAPNYPLPLYNLAVGFQKLAAATGPTTSIQKAAERIRTSIFHFPEMVSGDGRFDLSLAASFPNRLICKVGAEAIEGIGISEPPIGIAVKVHDGSFRALGAVCIEVLRQLNLMDEADNLQLLNPHRSPQIRNVRGLITGKIVADFELYKL
ncbi:MAG: asparaginase [Candidatus Zixiibacteriota bacterium]